MIWPIWLSVAVADRLAVPPEAIAPGVTDALATTTCATGCTISVVEPLAVAGVGPLQVAVTVRVMLRLPSVVFAAGV